MQRRSFLTMTAAVAWPVKAGAEGAVVEIGSRLEPFVDRFLLAEMEGAELRLGTPVDAGTAVALDRPWEGAFCGYFTVIRDGGVFRMYYRGEPASGKDGNADEVTCYAESRDGVRWQKPDLGLYEVAGSRKNNVILTRDAPFSHNFSPLLDARKGVKAGERYKALAGIHKSGLYAFVSGDGVHWRKWREQAVLPSPKEFVFDSQNVAFWSESEQRYVCYFRSWKKIGGVNYRWLSRTTSEDFLHWGPREEMSFGEAPPQHLYTNQTSPYPRAPHLYVGICARFFPGRQVLSEAQARAVQVDPGYFKDCSDAVLITSRGGTRYDRTFLDAFLRPGLGIENWVSRSNYPALNLVQTGAGEMSFYVNRNYGQPTAHLERYKLRLDGLASVHAGAADGEARTRALRFAGTKLVLNFSTSAGGGVRVELQDENGRPAAGYSLAEADELIGDEIERTVTWRGRSDVSALAGQAVRVRFVLKDSDLYSMRFQA
jgi:hypothetical protein